MNDLKNVIDNTTDWILAHLTTSNSFKCQLFDILRNEDKLSDDECLTVISEIENKLQTKGYECYKYQNDAQFTVKK